VRLLVIPPPAQPEVHAEVASCPDANGASRNVQFRQAIRKPLLDPSLREVVAAR
jgi:hypothetical protein